MKTIIAILLIGVAFLTGMRVAIFINEHRPPAQPVMPTRVAYQMFLRKYVPDLPVDGVLGSKTDAAADLYEAELTTKKWVEDYEKYDGESIHKKLWKE